MKKTIWLSILMIILAAAATGRAYDDGDFQLWLHAKTSGKITDVLSVKVEEEIRYGDDASQLCDEETLLLGVCRVNDWLKVGLGCRFVQERKEKTVVSPKTAPDGTVTYSAVGSGDHYWQNEKRPTADLVFGNNFAGWGLEDRVRFEWRMKDDGKNDYLRFRNRIKVKSPLRLTELKIRPYAAWEAFYEDKDELSGWDKLDRHRFYLGATAKLSDRIKSGLYYLLQRDRAGDDWKQAHVAGVEIAASF